MKANVIANRADACATCPTPCADRPAVADPCAACPLARPRWGQWDCAQVAGAGDRLAEQIEHRILAPIERAMPRAARLVAAVRGCGGCAAARNALNGGESGGGVV